MKLMEKLEAEIGKDRVLVVNSTMEVKELVPWQDAVTLIHADKGYMLFGCGDGAQLRSAYVTMDKPLVVVLHKYVQRFNRVYDMEDEVTKAHVRQRDGFTCLYCGEYGNTVDHIQPKSRGGRDTWSNLGTACKKCNGFKADRTPEEAGMKRPVIQAGSVQNKKLVAVQAAFYNALAEAV